MPTRNIVPFSPRSYAPAPRLARAIIVVALCCYGTMTVLNVVRTHPGTTELVVCVGLVLAVFGVQLAVSSPQARHWPTGWKVLILSVQAVLTFAPLVWFSTNWGSMQGPLAASLLLTLPARYAWPSYGVLIAFIPAYNLLAGATIDLVLYFTISGILTGLVIYGLTRLTDLVHEVHSTREELARMAVTQERLRFARDLHDLLGYSLSAITLKGELIQRLISSRPDKAREETASVLRVARQALADVRLVSSGYRDMSLSEEAESAGTVLAAADVRADVTVECGRLHPVVDTVLATALREGVTNILRHSGVQSCSIKAELDEETVRLGLTNDHPHVQADAFSARSGGGSGLDNLRTRFTAIGGGLTAGLQGDGRFHLEVWAPIRPQNQQDELLVLGPVPPERSAVA
ncbi:sensor histidine kinase [Streptomyces sp. NBC_01012]|uniref:sensor histidine kinase n=1 Tax=Streptomyces sp. NBC_01012 TaxID=2903717 RepID=UPI00386E2A3E|nr:histidine kinase [Streptomyces sp. NBC_01012]